MGDTSETLFGGAIGAWAILLPHRACWCGSFPCAWAHHDQHKTSLLVRFKETYRGYLGKWSWILYHDLLFGWFSTGGHRFTWKSTKQLRDAQIAKLRVELCIQHDLAKVMQISLRIIQVLKWSRGFWCIYVACVCVCASILSGSHLWSGHPRETWAITSFRISPRHWRSSNPDGRTWRHWRFGCQRPYVFLRVNPDIRGS